jgi:acyl-CoA thioester hydrolase
MTSPSFKIPIMIDPSDIDHMGHVNNAVYLSWAQKIAIDFWHAKASPDLVSSRLWVARNHNVEYLKPAFLDDALTGLLTFESFKGARVLFHLEITRGQDVLARIQSWWCSIDSITRRPAAVGKSFLVQLLTQREAAI